MEGARTVRGEESVSVRRDKSAREANIPLWARILSTVRAAQRKYRSIDIPPNAVNGCAIPSHPFDRSTRSTDRSLPVGQSEGEERRDERATMRRRHNLQDRWVPRACSRTPPPPEEKEEGEEGWARRRGRAKNRSLIGIKT